MLSTPKRTEEEKPKHSPVKPTDAKETKKQRNNKKLNKIRKKLITNDLFTMKFTCHLSEVMLKIISKEKLSPWYAMTHSLRFKFHSVSQAAFIFKKLKCFEPLLWPGKCA